MYQYQQSTGILMRDGERIGQGYSGRGLGWNQPQAQAMSRTGPIPQGKYRIDPTCSEAHLGPCPLRLVPDPANLMFGRSGFFIHGDNSLLNNTGSEGCIILSRDIREGIIQSNDYELFVRA